MLAGIRVLDLSRVIAGPYCAMLLADLGADVIKVERPERGDDLREWRARTGRPGMSAVFAAINRNKRGIALDLQKPDGARLLRDLAARSDVLVENFVPGVADRLGVGYAGRERRESRDRLRVGERVRPDRPLRAAARLQHDRAGHGRAHGHHRHAGPSADAGGRLDRRRGGGVSLVRRHQRGAGAPAPHRPRTASRREPARRDARAPPRPRRPSLRLRASARRASATGIPTLTPAEAFRTKDGWLNVVLMNAEQWDRFCRVLGDEVLRTEPRFATNLARLENHEEMKTRVETALAAGTTAEWVVRFEAASIAGGPIYELDEVFDDRQVQPPRDAGRGGAADVRGARRARPDAGVPLPGLRDPGVDPAARSAPRRAHRRGAPAKSSISRRPRSRRWPSPARSGSPRLPEARQPGGRLATKRKRVRLKK